jgi:hypothetical protein
MKFGEESLKEKIKKRLEVRGANITISEEELDDEESNFSLNLNKLNQIFNFK